VSDEAGYLDSLGRRKTAEVIAAARTAEAAKQAEAEEAEAESKRRAEVAKAKSMQAIKAAEIEVDREVKTAQAVASAAARKAEAEQRAAAEEAEASGRRRAEVAKAQADQAIRDAQISADRDVQTAKAVADQVVESENNNLRVKKADLEKVAIIREKEAEVAGQKAQAQFEQELETERIALQQRRLTADVIEPARAKKESMELEAKGAAAPIIEKGHAQLQVLREMISTYQSANGEGEKIFMLNMLPEILTRLTETVGRVTIDKVSVIDTGSGNGHGHGIGRFVNQFPSAVLSLAEQIETATGVNILSQFQPNAPVWQPPGDATVVAPKPTAGKVDATA
jgi:flotillin